MSTGRNLPNSDAIPKTSLLTVLGFGDSNMQAFNVTPAEAWPGQVRDTYINGRTSRGTGFRGLVHWSLTGSATRVTPSDAYDKIAFCSQRRLTGSGNVYRYTKTGGETIAAGSRIIYVDAAGSGNWSYSIDGAAYQASGAATAGDNAIKAITLASPVTSTLDIRGRNAANSADAQCDLGGLDIRANSTGTFLFHNDAIVGHRLSGGTDALSLNPLVHTSSGDALALINFLDPDIVTIAFTPNDVTVSINESVPDYLQVYTDGIEAIATRAAAINADVIVFVYPEDILNGVATEENLRRQGEFRQATIDTAADLDISCINIHRPFGNSFAAADALGYWQSDDTHLTVSGHSKWAEKFAHRLNSVGSFAAVKT